MKYVINILLMVLFTLVASPFCWSQEAEDPTKCPYCKTTGKLTNPFFEKYSTQEAGIKYCSWTIEKDDKGFGLPWIPCEKCRNAPLKAKAEKEFEVLVARRKGWLEERRMVDSELKVREPLLHLETEHFVWVWSMPKFTWKKKSYRSHDGLHLLANLMEEFYADFQKVHNISDEDNINNTHYIYSFERELIAKKACMLYGEQSSPNGQVTKQGQPSVFVTWLNKNKMPSMEDFHCNMIHMVTHLFTAVYKTCWWLYDTGFAYEGSAHWWEIYYYNKASSFCFRELNSGSGWIQSKWQSRVKKMVLAEKEPSFSDMILIPGGSMTAEQHLFSWSYIDYMIFMDPHKTLDFFNLLKQKRPVRDALLQIWQKSILGFEEEWIEYVKSEYKVQETIAPTKRTMRRR